MRLLRVLAVVIATACSLITFPAHVSWVVAFWLVCFVSSALFGRRGWLPLILLAAILIIKGLNWSLSLLLLIAACLVVAIVRYRLPTDDLINRRSLAFTATIAGLVALAAWFALQRHFEANCYTKPPVLDLTRPVVCLGDSLTAAGYPEELAKLVAVPVENFGFDGINTDQAIALLPKISAQNPQVVVIEIGGHDYNQGSSRKMTHLNLERLVVACENMDARVVLVEIPRGFVSDPFTGIERNLAGQHDLQLLSDGTIRQFVFWSPICPPGMWVDSSQHYSRDGLHPNNLGNQFFAKQVAQAISGILGPNVMRNQ